MSVVLLFMTCLNQTGVSTLVHMFTCGNKHFRIGIEIVESYLRRITNPICSRVVLCHIN